jgi:hypothetical protein
MGGCLSGAGGQAKNDLVCFYGYTTNSKDPWAANKGSLQDMLPRTLPAANFDTAKVVTGDTKITAAKWYMTLAGKNCSAIKK